MPRANRSLTSTLLHGMTWLGLLVLVTAPALGTGPGSETSLTPHGFPLELAPPLPDAGTSPVQLVLDDDSAEGVFGILGTSARQFLWFNRFDNPGAFQLEEIWVLFPNDVDIPVGGAVQLAVFLDPDQDPLNGATLVTTYDETIQATDGSTFSVYPLNPPLVITDPGDVLIGVVNRYYQTGIDPPGTQPAAVDTTTGQGRSYFALWSGDAPTNLDLASASVIDVLDGLASGNHLVRGFGGPVPLASIPTLGFAGLAVLALLLGLSGLLLVSRLRP